MLILTGAPGGGSFGSSVFVSSSSLITALSIRPWPVWLLQSDSAFPSAPATRAAVGIGSSVNSATPLPSPNLSFLCQGKDENRTRRRCRAGAWTEPDPSSAQIDLPRHAPCEHARYRNNS